MRIFWLWMRSVKLGDLAGQLGHRVGAIVTDRLHDVLIGLDLGVGMQFIEGLVTHVGSLDPELRLEQRHHHPLGIDDDESRLTS